MNETITEETVEADVVDFPTVEIPEDVEYHTILEIWKAVLSPARTEREQRINPGWANKICQNYHQIAFADVRKVHESYFGKILQLLEILELEIDGDEDCLKPDEAAEDAEVNAHHYKNLILNWQSAILMWELLWDCTDEDAAVEIAAISEVQRMFFGEIGLVGYLDQINFQFTEDDQAMLGEALEELRAGTGE